MMIERTVTVNNELGLHARPAAKFVKMAAMFSSSVELVRDDSAVNGKSIMGVMMLEAECGAVLVIRVHGDDAEAAADALQQLVATGFGE